MPADMLTLAAIVHRAEGDLRSILGLAETCRSSTPGPCRPDWPPFPQWYRVTRRGLDCAFAPERHACYLSRKMLGRPPGPAERHHWAKRRTLERRAARQAIELAGCRFWALPADEDCATAAEIVRLRIVPREVQGDQ